MSRRSRHQAGLTLIDTMVGAIVATFVAAMAIGFQVAVTTAIGGINQHATFQTTLAQATDRMVKDFMTADQALTSWNGLSSDATSSGDGIARWILEVPELNADATQAPLAHVVYEYQSALSQWQLQRIYYAPGSTTPTNTSVVANAVEQVTFSRCDLLMSEFTDCTDIYLLLRTNSALPGASSFPRHLNARGVYRNSP